MYYFTFGQGGTQVFNRGWVRINASTLPEAVEKFKARYGDRAMVGNFVNCAFMYTEEDFKLSIMYENQNNLGAAEQDYIP